MNQINEEQQEEKQEDNRKIYKKMHKIMFNSRWCYPDLGHCFEGRGLQRILLLAADVFCVLLRGDAEVWRARPLEWRGAQKERQRRYK